MGNHNVQQKFVPAVAATQSPFAREHEGCRTEAQILHDGHRVLMNELSEKIAALHYLQASAVISTDAEKCDNGHTAVTRRTNYITTKGEKQLGQQ